MASGKPEALWSWFVASLLSCVHLGHGLAARGARALLVEHCLTSPTKMLSVGWEERTRILNRSGYARLDESRSRYLEQAASSVVQTYGGDLNRYSTYGRAGLP